MAIAEMSMMTASSLEAFVHLGRPTHLLYGIDVAASAGFVHFYYDNIRLVHDALGTYTFVPLLLKAATASVRLTNMRSVPSALPKGVRLITL